MREEKYNYIYVFKKQYLKGYVVYKKTKAEIRNEKIDSI